MTGPEHYAEAERLLELATTHPSHNVQISWTARAQVHAILALAAAAGWPVTLGPPRAEEPF